MFFSINLVKGNDSRITGRVFCLHRQEPRLRLIRHLPGVFDSWWSAITEILLERGRNRINNILDILLAGSQCWEVVNKGLGDHVQTPVRDHLDVLRARVVGHLFSSKKRGVTLMVDSG